jgi:sugar O-acyltransferase (sialic acid O-acetyltransferase NeuD family)
MNRKVLIYGNGLYAQMFYRTNQDRQVVDIVAFTADREFVGDDSLFGMPVRPFEEIKTFYPPEEFDMMIVIGYSTMRYREILFNKAKKKGYQLRNYIDPHAVIPSDLVLGENNFISEGVCIGPFVQIGDNNTIRPKTYIGHHVHLGHHNYIAPGCLIGGECRVDSLSFIGIGSTLIDSTHLGNETLVGAGSLILKNTDPHSQYIGRPAKKVGEHAVNGIIIRH